MDVEFEKREKSWGSQVRGGAVGLWGVGGRAGSVNKIMVDSQWVKRGAGTP